MSQTPHTSNAARQMTGGQALAEMLQVADIGPIFGMGGFQLLPFYEACRVLGLRHTLINDERSRGVCGRCLCQGHQPAWLRRRNARTGRDQSRNRAGREPECGHADHRHRRRRQPPACDQEHDAGDAPARGAAPGREGGDPRRGDRAHPGAHAPRLCGGDQRTAGASADRCARGCRPRRARVRCRRLLDRPQDDRRTRPPLPRRCKRRRGRRRADRQSRASDHPGGRRRAHLGRLCGAGGPRREPGHAGGAHHERQGRDRLHPRALGRPVRTLRPHRQRADRRERLPAGGRLQAGRDRHQALYSYSTRQDGDPHRVGPGRDRPHHPRQRGTGVGRAPRAGGSVRGTRKGHAGRRSSRRLVRSSAKTHGRLARDGTRSAAFGRAADQRRPPDA